MAKAYSTALWMYDLTGGVRIGKRHQRLSRDDALAHFPALNADRLVAGFLYWDARADDARVTLTVARTAVVNYGAVAANYAGASGCSRTRPPGGSSAPAWMTGPRSGPMRWSTPAGYGPTRSAASTRASRRTATLRPAKGIHLTFPADRLRCDIAAVLPGARRSPFDLRGAVGRLHLRRHDRHRLPRTARRPAVHRRRTWRTSWTRSTPP